MSSLDQALQNQLLAALPPADYQALHPHLEWVSLSLGQVLYDAGDPIAQVYFPLEALISLISSVNSDSATAFGLIGNEGLFGIPALLGGHSTISRAMVQMPGGAIKIDAQILQAAFDQGGVLQKQLLLYIQLFVTQTVQNAACQSHHHIESRLARWLLSLQDRLHQDELILTQGHIAKLLGTRRATVTEAAGQLQQKGTIRYRRGEIVILNRDALEQAACRCYSLLRHEQDRLQALKQTVA